MRKKLIFKKVYTCWMSWDIWCSSFLMRSSLTGSPLSVTVERTGCVRGGSGCVTGSVITSEVAPLWRNWVSSWSMRGVVRGASPLTCNGNFHFYFRVSKCKSVVSNYNVFTGLHCRDRKELITAGKMASTAVCFPVEKQTETAIWCNEYAK